jgi:O-antigen ligase
VTVSAKHLAIVLLGLICGLIFFGQDLRIGLRIRIFDVGLIAVGAVFAWHALTLGVARQTAPFMIAFSTFVLYMTCNALLQGTTGTAVKELTQMALFGVFFVALAQFLDDRRSLTAFLAVMLVTLWALALQNAALHVSMGSFAGWKTLGDQKLTHSVIVLTMAVVTISPLRPKGWWWIAVLIAAVVMLFLSGERKGWVATALAVFVALVISDQGGIGRRAVRRTLGVALSSAGLVAIAAVFAPFVPYLEKQLFSSMDFVTLLLSDDAGLGAGTTTESNRNRLAMIEIAIQQMRENPVFGIGPEAFRSDALARGFLPIPAGDIATGPHNEILRIGAELGVVGLTLYLLALGVVLFRTLVLIEAMPRLDAAERLRLRLGFAFFVYGFIVNLFLAGGGLNTFFVMLPAALVFSVRLPDPRPATAPWQPAPRPMC